MKKKQKKMIFFVLLFGMLAISWTGTGFGMFDDPAVEVTAAAKPKNQFVQKKGKWYYYDKNGKIVKGWYTAASGNKYYFGTDGAAKTGWKKVGKEYYYFNSHGKMAVNCFRKNGKSTYYLKADGTMAKGRRKIGKSWYSFNRNTGRMVKNGWYKETDGSYYYAGTDGKLISGFYKPDSYYRYFRPSDCKMLTGWQNINGKRYYFKKKNGLRYDNIKITSASGKMYYFSKYGVLYQNRWFTKNGTTYYAKADGVLATGWLTISGNKYYLNPKTGARVTGWKTIGKNKYYLNPSTGIMAVNQWVDSDHYVGNDGAWIPEYKKTFLRWPLSSSYKTITSYFGYRVSPGGIGSTNHKGIDIAAPTGAPIYASASGTVVAILNPSQSNGGGNYTKIDHGKGVMTEYMHQSKFKKGLKVGDKVKKGDLIGYVGATGNVTGPHLHFGVIIDGEKVDPLKFTKKP